jgi:hypothetical protein
MRSASSVDAVLCFWHCNGDVAELQTAGMIALDIERSGLAFICIQCAAGDALNFLGVNYFDPISD